MPAGSLVGSLASSFIADRFSRKIALQVSCILWVIGSIIQCASVDRGMLCAGRVVGGLSFITFPVLFTEPGKLYALRPVNPSTVRNFAN